MKYLESVRLVQFFLYEKEELRLGKICAIVGPNASGKSAIMDAVQIALLGGNSRHVALNAQADETTTTRSLRSYCLGVIGEREEDRTRESATTYITLVWRDSDTNEPVSMGVCIHAEVGRDGHEVVGRYVARGVEIAMGDHLETVDGKERPRAWQSFRHQLIERYKAVTGDDELIYTDSERYVRAALLALRGEGGSTSSEAFVRALRFGLRMRFNKTVDAIVRDEVLEARPTNIKKFKEVTDSFRQLAETVAHVEAKIAAGTGVEKLFAKAAEESARAATWAALGRDAQHEACSDALNRASKNRLDAEGVLQDREAEHKAGMEEEARVTQEALHFRQLRESHSAHKDYGALQTEIKMTTEMVKTKKGDITANLGLVRNSISTASASAYAGRNRAEYDAAAQALDVFSANLELESRAGLQKALRPALRCVAKAVNELLGHGHSVEHALIEANTQLQSAQNALQRISEGRALLSTDVQRLMTELTNAGIGVVPVCDLVHITDPAWQPVIEAHLGRNAEALLVDAGRERDAFNILRSMTGRNAVYWTKVVSPGKVNVDFRPAPGTVAELIQGDNLIAVGYLRQRFRNALRTDSSDEALSVPYAFTRDGMRHADGEFYRIRPLPADQLKIGAGGVGHAKAAQDELRRAQAEVTWLQKKKQDVAAIQKILTQFANEEHVMTYLQSAWDEMTAMAHKLEALTHQMTAAADEEYVRLGEAEQRCEAQAKNLAQVNSELMEGIGTAKTRLAQCVMEEEVATIALQAAEQAAQAIRANPEYDTEFAVKQWDLLLARYERRYDEMIAHCERVQKEFARRMQGTINSAINDLGAFVQNFHEHAPAQGEYFDWQKARAWLLDLLKRLRDTDLLKYKAQMDEAYKASQETFRSDVAIALAEHLEWLESTMDRLNSVLRECPTFSNGERYRFRRTVRPQLALLYKFVKDIAAHGPTDDLWGSAGGVPDQFRQLLDDKVALGAAGARSPLDDYREFFEFDIDVLREDPVTRANKVVASMSNRIGSGSGGEHRAPLYVIAGAALASAYRLDRGNTGGLRLMLIDEAFVKMDPTNIVATMRYLEQLGLQVFLATAGEHLATLTAFLDRYYDIFRDADNNVLLTSAHDVSAEARAMFREDLPEFNPELVEQEMAALRSSAPAHALA